VPNAPSALPMLTAVATAVAVAATAARRRTLVLIACAALAGVTPGCRGDREAGSGTAAGSAAGTAAGSAAQASPAGAGAAPSGKGSAAAGTPGAPGAPSAAGAPGSLDAAGNARKLALMAPEGNSAADQEIQALSRRAEQADQPDVWVMLGRAWVRKARASADPGFYLNASAAADAALDIDPGHRAALNLRGLVLINEHRFAAALETADQILARDPDDPTALGTRSDALLELGRFADAAEAAQRMVDIKPNLPSYARASYIRWLQGDGAAAKKIIRLAIDARDPRDPEPGAWVLVQAAMIFWHEGDYPGADKGFDQALEAVREYPPALVGKGRVAMARGDFPRAAELLERSYRQSPLPETAWLLGDARRAAGDEAGAAKAYADVVKAGRQMDPRTLAQYYATRGADAEEAEEALRLAEAERRTRADIYTEDAHAWALYRAGKLAEARAASDRALALGTRDARLLYHAGAIRIAAGDRAGGEKLVREALKLNPKFDWTAAAEAGKMLADGGKGSKAGG